MSTQWTKTEVKAILNEVGVKSVFTQNAKMKRSSKDGVHLYNFGIPAFRSQNGTITCPNAKACVSGCYAKSGAYLWSNVAQAYENRLSLTRTRGFVEVIKSQIHDLLNKHKTGQILLRIHDSGDFYSKGYQIEWYAIATAFYTNPRVMFYAYTKMISQSKDLSPIQPSNFRLIFSLGGNEDKLIDQDKDRHAKVFSNDQSLFKSGYIDATADDRLAALYNHNKIGLVYHGVKNYSNTNWSRVD